jgi:predicted alpha/beta hydrolase family esterase
LGIHDRKFTGLLRGLVWAPQLLVVDVELFDNVNQADCDAWMAALEMFVQEAEDRAVLVVSSGTMPLRWKIIGQTQQMGQT